MIDFLMKNVTINAVPQGDAWLNQNRALTGIMGPVGSIPGDDTYKRSIFFYYLYDFLHPARVDKQTVFYGSPGTGKTYMAERTARDHYYTWRSLSGANDPEFDKVYQFVQFHPSFTYEDFVEGIRPSTLVAGTSKLDLVNGIFKEFCKKAAQWEFDYYNTVDFKNSVKNSQKAPSFEILKVKQVKETDLCIKDCWKHLEDKPGDDLVLQYIPPFFFVMDASLCSAIII
jgi:5-methylcytosine-specific restriction protein B